MIDHFCARNSNHQQNATGNNTAFTVGWDSVISSQGITYNSTTKKCTVPSTGLYLVSWSFYPGNLVANNTSSAWWVHGGGNSSIASQEPYAYNGNPAVAANPGGASGAGSDMIAVAGSMTFYIDTNVDDKIFIIGRVANNSSDNVSIVYDGYFSIVKLA